MGAAAAAYAEQHLDRAASLSGMMAMLLRRYGDEVSLTGAGSRAYVPLETLGSSEARAMRLRDKQELAS
jgi:uncharacterized protein (DUF58 family)